MTGVEAARLYAIVGANLTGLEKGMAEAEGIVSNSARRMDSKLKTFVDGTSKVWKRLALGASVVAVASGAMGMNFQKQMTLIQSSAGGTTRDVKVLSKQVLDLAKTAPQGPGELSKAMYHLKSLGLDNAQAMGVLKQSVRGAIAGQADLEAVTNALGGAVRTGIKGTGDYAKAMATLSATAGAGNMRMDDLTAALGTGILPAAKAAGLSIKDVGAALALMTDENVPADAAATRLRMSFSLLAAPSKHANDILQKIGLSGDKLAHEMQSPAGLLGTVTMLRDHLYQLKDPAQRFQVLSQAFGGGRTAGAIMMLVNNLDVLGQKYKQIGKGAKNFDEEVAAQEATAINKLKKAWSSVEVALIKASGSILAPFVKLGQGVAKVADAFSSLSPKAQKTILVLVGSSIAALGLAVAVGKVTLAIKGVIAGTNAAGVAIKGLSVAIGFLAANPIVAVIAGIAALGIALVVAYKKSETFRNVVNGVFKWLSDTVKTLSVYIPRTFEYIWDQLKLNALQAALGVVEPFSHLPGFLGGWARKAKANFQAEIDKIHAPSMDWSDAAAAAGVKSGRAWAQAFSEAAKNGQVATVKQVGTKAPAGYLSGTYGMQMSTRTNPGGFVAAPSVKGGASGKQKLLALAKAALGTPYLWGGNGPGGFDCSGLVEWAFANGLNVSIPRTTYGQAKMGRAVSVSQAKVGDVVFTNYGEGGKAGPGHEGLIVGFKGGQPIVESAPHTGAVVHTSSLSAFAGGGQFQIRDLLAKAAPVVEKPGSLVLKPGSIYQTGSGKHSKSIPSGDKLISEKLRDAIAHAQNEAQTAQGTVARKWLNVELHDLEQAKGTLTGKLKGATGKQRAAIKDEIRSIDGRIADVNKGITSNLKEQRDAIKQAFAQKVSAARSAISSAVSSIKSALDQQFEKATQDYINSVLAPRFFQGTDTHGMALQTPAEKLLAKMQAEDTANQLQAALDDARKTLASDKANPQTTADQLAADQKALEQAQRSITENELSIKATAERAQADHDYAAAVQKYQDERTAKEAQLNAELDKWGAGLADGTTKLTGLNGIVAQFGLTMADVTDPATGIGQDFLTLSNAVDTLSKTLLEEAAKLAALSDKAEAKKLREQAGKIGGHTAAFGGTGSTTSGLGGASGYFKLNPFAAGGIVTGPTAALIGEAGPEAVTPLSQLTSLIAEAMKKASPTGTSTTNPVVHIERMEVTNDLDPELAALRIGREVTTRLGAA